MGAVDHVEQTVKVRAAVPERPDTEATLVAALRRQADMASEVRRRLAEDAARVRRAESESVDAEREAAQLEVHASVASAEGDEGSAGEALRRRAAVLDRLTALEEERLALAEREQRLLGLQKQLGQRIEDLGVLIGTIRASTGAQSVASLVDQALAAAEGSAQDEDEYDAAF